MGTFLAAVLSAQLMLCSGSIHDGYVAAWGAQSIAATTVVRYMSPGFGDAVASTSPVQYRIPFDVVAKHMYVRQNAPAGNGAPAVYTLTVNGVDTPLAVSIPSTSLDGSMTTSQVLIGAGDLIGMKVTKGASLGTSPGDIIVTIWFR